MDVEGGKRRPGAPTETEVGPSEDHAETFALLFEDQRSRLIKLSHRKLGRAEGAEDAVGETYLRAYQSRASFDGRNFAGWLARIAQRACIDHLRREIRYQQPDVATEPVSADSEVRILTAMQIRAVLSSLPAAQRQCLKLFYIEGFSAKDVAKKTGFTEMQVKSHLQNGRRNFMRAWRATEDQGEG